MKYKNLAAAIVALASSTLFIIPANAQICTTPSVPVNGCSVPEYVALVDPVLISAFSSIFAGACNSHDVCYQTIGGSRSACDDKFRGDMRAQCDSSFNRWFDPGGWEFCKNVAAEGYYTAVKNYGGPYWSQGQRDTLDKAQEIHAQVNAEQCGTTADRTKYYSPALTSYVSNAFATRAGRQPTTFEMFDGLHAADPTGDLLTWQTAVNGYASSRAAVPVPSVVVTRSSNDWQVFLTATATPADSPVSMKVNGTTYGATAALPAPSNMYKTRIYQFQGFALARSVLGGARELSLIDFTVTRRAECTPICP